MGKIMWPSHKSLLFALGLLCICLLGTAWGQPHISVWPDSLSDSLFTGISFAHTMTVSNVGDSNLVFYISTEETTGKRFFNRTHRSPGITSQPQHILLLEDDCGTPFYYHYNTALNNLNLPRTLVTEWSDLEIELNSGIPWDLVIVNSYEEDFLWSVLDSLYAYQGNGGKIIYAHAGVWRYFYHPLLLSFGVDMHRDFETPIDFYAINNTLLVFKYPNQIEHLYWTDDACWVDGQFVEPRYGGTQLAAFQGYPEKAAIMLNAAGNCIFNAFQSANFNEDHDLDGKLDIVELIENEIMLLFGVEWLFVTPNSGELTPDSTLDVQVIFDAGGLGDGDYHANIVIESNDPDDPQVLIPANLHVTGAPDIDLSETSIDFGSVFTVSSLTKTLSVRNLGVEILTVSDIFSDHGDFTVEITSFHVHPLESREILVTFEPSSPGDFSGILTIESDDPDEPAVMVDLKGEGIIAPNISVSPDSLADSLFAGELSVHRVTIYNDGGSDLVWEGHISDRVVINEIVTATDWIELCNATRDTVNLQGWRISWKDVYGNRDSSYLPEFYLPPKAYVVLAEMSGLPTSTHIYLGKNILWNAQGNGSAALFDNTGAAVDFVRWGGSNQPPPGGTHWFETIPIPTPDDQHCLGRDAWSTDTDYSADWSIQLPTEAQQNQPSAKAKRTTDGGFHLDSKRDYANFLIHQRSGQGALKNSWISISPAGGTIPPSDSTSVDVTFDAAGLIAGDYLADVAFTSNDPDEPQVLVPVDLQVTGEPSIALSDTNLEYGTIYVGVSEKDTLTVSNVGTDVLTVSNIFSDHPDFNPQITNFILEPYHEREIQVTFTPSDTGHIEGTLTIESDDPAHPTVTVTMTGRGEPPPIVSTSPDSLSDSLFVGETSAEWLTIFNQGGSELIFGLAIKEVSSKQSKGDGESNHSVKELVEEPGWLALDPTSGTVPPYDSTNVEVTFDASDLNGGDYYARIAISSNDPFHPVRSVPVYLQVTGEPDIVVSDSLLDIGFAFIGYSAEDTFTISNVGTDLLTVEDIFSDNEHFSVDTTFFSLDPEESQEIIVSFAPSDTGSIEGTLFIESNDLDEPVVTLALVGEGLIPPDISLSPDSLYQVISLGEKDSAEVLIANIGGSDLRWEAHYILGFSTLFDVDILFDTSHGQPSSDIWTTIIADLTSRGATFTENADILTLDLLNQYEVLWFAEADISPTSSEVSAIQDWVTNGGALLLEGDSNPTVPIYNDLLSALGAGITYLNLHGVPGFTTNIFPHVTTAMVDSIFFLSNLAQLSSITAPASLLINDASGNANTAYSLVGEGRIMAMADEVFSDNHIWRVDNQRFANQVFDWLTKKVHWISLAPEAGTVPADSSDDLTVTFDAALSGSGDFSAQIVFFSNDPDEPEASIPVHLHVLGNPDIVTSDSSLYYGIVYIGTEATDTLTIFNAGNDLLTVSDIHCDLGDFAVDTTSFSLVPLENQKILVSFSPSSPGDIEGTMIIESDDPDTPFLAIALSGHGLPPPDISVSPDSLVDSLFAGTTSIELLNISNEGESDLTFRIYTREKIESSKRSARLSSTWWGATDRAIDQLSIGPSIAPHRSGSSDVIMDENQESSKAGKELREGLTILMLTASGDPSEIQTALLCFPDVVSVDVYNALFSTPLLNELTPYYAVIVANSQHFDDPVAIGDVLADYVDSGGGLVLTLASFANGLEVQGRLLDDGYMPFEIGNSAASPSNLGNFSTNHPIMTGVTTAYSNVVWRTALAPEAELVAEWENGYPCVATKGWNVTAVNVFVGSPGHWTGDVPLILRNAAAWSYGTISWMIPTPLSGTIPADSSADITIFFDATNLNAGDAYADIFIVSNDPDEQETAVPVHLFVRELPRIAVLQDTLNMGLITLEILAAKSLWISNIGQEVLDIHRFSFDDGSYFSAGVEAASLKPGDTLEVAVTFLTSEFRPRFTDMLLIYSNDPFDPIHPVYLEASCDLSSPETINDLIIGLADRDILLWWTEPYDDSWVSYYIIYRRTDAGTLGDSLATTVKTIYTDFGVVDEMQSTYYYTVKAVDAAGRKSENSNMVGEFTTQLSGGTMTKH